MATLLTDRDCRSCSGRLIRYRTSRVLVVSQLRPAEPGVRALADGGSGGREFRRANQSFDLAFHGVSVVDLREARHPARGPAAAVDAELVSRS